MGRYATDSFTTSTIAPSASVTVHRSIRWNYIDILKIKATPSAGSGNIKIRLYKKDTVTDADKVWGTKPFSGVGNDPVEDDGTTLTERGEGFVVPYQDLDKTLEAHWVVENLDTVSKTVTVDYSYVPGASGDADVAGVPEDIVTGCIPTGLTIAFSAAAKRNNSGITAAELRVKLVSAATTLPDVIDMRTAAEGGSFAHDGTTTFIYTGVSANAGGAIKEIAFGSGGRAYFAWKLINGVGPSLWTDGNASPSRVTQFCLTQDAAGAVDTGPPSGWTLSVERGPVSNTVQVRVKRPATNGRLIRTWTVQIKDASTGSWRAIDANAGAAAVHFDGSAIGHTLMNNATRVQRTAGSGMGTAVVGDIALVDVRGAAYNNQYLTGAVVTAVGTNYVDLSSPINVQAPASTDLRMTIVKPFWTWASEGYLGAQPNQGIWQAPNIDDTTTLEFLSQPIEIPASLSISNVQARVFFTNGYSTNDNSLTTGSFSAVCGGGVYGPRLLTDFSDRRFWVPAPNAKMALAFNDGGAGGLLITMAQTHLGGATNLLFAGGVKSRFKIMPDLTTKQIVIRSKFTKVSWTNDGATNDEAIFGIVMPTAQGYALGHGIFDNGLPEFAGVKIANFGVGPNSADSHTGVSVTSTFETKITIAHETGSGSLQYYRITEAAHKEDSGSFAAMSLPIVGSYDSRSFGIMPQVFGLEVLVGLMAISLHADLSARLDQFEVVEGIIWL